MSLILMMLFILMMSFNADDVIKQENWGRWDGGGAVTMSPNLGSGTPCEGGDDVIKGVGVCDTDDVTKGVCM